MENYQNFRHVGSTNLEVLIDAGRKPTNPLIVIETITRENPDTMKTEEKTNVVYSGKEDDKLSILNEFKNNPDKYRILFPWMWTKSTNVFEFTQSDAESILESYNKSL